MFWNIKKVKPFAKLSQFPKRSRTENRLIDKKPFGDKDKDKLMNFFDCKPMNRKKQGWAHRGHTFERETTTHVKMMSPDKFLRTTYIETTNREKPVGAKNYPLYAKSYKDYSEQVISQGNVDRLKKVIRSKQGKMEVPYLIYDEQGRPTGHEGRHRATAAKQIGIKKIPVTIARRLKGRDIRDWKKMREYQGAKKDWKKELENEDEITSSKSADIPIKEQRRYGEERPEALSDYDEIAEEPQTEYDEEPEYEIEYEEEEVSNGK